jgi:phage shock protein C
MDQAKIAGVCSGLAVHFGWKLTGVRLALIALCIFMPPLGFALYLAGAVLLPAQDSDGRFRPAVLGGLFNCSSRQYAGAGGFGAVAPAAPPAVAPAQGSTSWSAPNVGAHDVAERTHDLEQRLRDIEAYMTSTRYEFDRELRSSR